MSRRLLGYHHLILPDGTRHDLVVAEFGAEGNLLSWHPLLTEEAGVEWVGGTLNLEVTSDSH